MRHRDEAAALLREICDCSPEGFFRQIDKSRQGIDFTLAFLVKADGRVTSGTIARELNVSTARIAVILNKMEKNKLVIRRTSAEDARRTIVEITPEGIARAEELREQSLEKLDLLLDRVGVEDLREFIRISQKIKSALEK